MGYTLIIDFKQKPCYDYEAVSNIISTDEEMVEYLLELLLDLEEEYETKLIHTHAQKLLDQPLCKPYIMKINDKEELTMIVMPSSL